MLTIGFTPYSSCFTTSPVAVSQTCTMPQTPRSAERSHELAARCAPSGRHVAAAMPLAFHFSVFSSLPLAASQMRRVESEAAVSTFEPSGLKTALQSPAVWPRNSTISFALFKSQILAVRSAEAVTANLPSGDKDTCVTVASCAAMVAML